MIKTKKEATATRESGMTTTKTNNSAARDEGQKLRELCDTVRFDYLDEKAARARIICCVLNDTLGDDVSFVASHELLNFGPKNDWNGHHSAATRVAREWEARILNPALVTGCAMKAKRQAAK